MKIYLFDTIESHENLLPLSYTRPLADFRCGILTIREKWEKRMPSDYGYYPVEYLRETYGTVSNPSEESLFISGNLLPREDLIEEVKNLKVGEAILKDKSVVVFRGTLEDFESKKWEEKKTSGKLNILHYVYDIFLQNPEEIKEDYIVLTKGRKSLPIPDCIRSLYGKEGRDIESNIFIEEGATVECATINIKEGPVYIGKDSKLMEGACIRGPFALCDCSEVRMGSKIYEGTTIGPHCKVGGEVSNTVFFGYSNKAHDGYLGNAVIGEWCNIGAGTNASNLKNDYSLIRVWNFRTHTFMRTDLQFCGVIMGDHSKIGVNCMINTATVIGVGVNIHGAGFPRVFLSNFCEGSPLAGFVEVPLNKFLEIVERVMSRRDKVPSTAYLNMLRMLYDSTGLYK